MRNLLLLFLSSSCQIYKSGNDSTDYRPPANTANFNKVEKTFDSALADE